jgi:hypothetical protein
MRSFSGFGGAADLRTATILATANTPTTAINKNPCRITIDVPGLYLSGTCLRTDILFSRSRGVARLKWEDWAAA